MTFKYKIGSEIHQKFGPFHLREGLITVEDKAGRLVEKVKRNSFDPGDSVAALLHDTASGEIILTKQWRYPAVTGRSFGGELLELAAGRIDKEDDDAVTAIVREACEETGIALDPASLEVISECFPSPGGSSEIITVFYAPFHEQETEPRGGLDGEYIQVLRFPVAEFMELLLNGQIRDMKTALAGYWALANGKIGG
jgi:nudix-type nucleoside diphosphatase (YffH/AdpP family)